MNRIEPFCWRFYCQQLWLGNRLMKRYRITVLLGMAVLAFRSAGDAAAYYDTNAVVTTYAGSGFFGYLNGTGTQTMFDHPTVLAMGPQSIAVVWDSWNSRFRKIDAEQVVTAFAGKEGNAPSDGVGETAGFRDVRDICLMPNGSFAVADGNAIRLMTPQATADS